jgi:hypothetical protein
MAAGGPGDDPITDIVTYQLPVFGPAADRLVAEIHALGGTDEIMSMCRAEYWPPKHHAPDRVASATFLTKLQEIRVRVEADARQRGWEADSLLDSARWADE